jgi:4,5-dihydroxyphthalate decarboxylase
MNELPLTLAISLYDHTRDVAEGRVPVPGVRLTHLPLEIPEIAARFTAHREWDVSELGLGKYTALRAGGDTSITAIPVFPCRAFRQSSVYVRADSPLLALEELAGRRVGIPEWAQTATIYARGFLAETYGVDLASIEWVQAGVDEPGRPEKVRIRPPDGVIVTPRPDATLDGMLLAGELDAVVSAQAPRSFAPHGGAVRRLLADPRTVEEAYLRETGIFPIMHIIAIRQAVLDEHPWVAGNFVRAFTEAKRRSVARAMDPTAWRMPVPWISDLAERADVAMDGDMWPYGLEANRTTLDAFLRFAHEQGVTEQRLTPEELFTPTTHRSIRV